MSVTNINIPTAQSFLLVDTRTGPNKVLFLPTASTIQGRYLSIKDYYGNATNSSLTISTTGLDRIDQRGIRYTLASSFGSVMLLSDGLRSWNMLGLYEGGDTAIGGVAGPVSNGTVTATGGTVTTSGSYKIHTFTAGGTFALTSPSAITAQVLVVGGGGAGGSAYVGGGGGAGGAVFNGSFTIAAGSYTVTVGAGGVRTVAGVGYVGPSGANSSFSSITGTGGGGGGSYMNVAATNGGCGGGGPFNSGQFGTGSQGGNGAPYGTDGNGGFSCGGGGGGMGGTAPTPANSRPNGGAGATYTVAGTAYTLAGGGGAGSDSLGGLGQAGGGLGGNGNQNGQSASSGTDATANTGSGGGGGGGNNGTLYGGAGGSGIVIIAYTTIFYNTWQYVRFTLVLTRGQYSTREWQMSEFTLKYQGSPVSYTGATISPVMGGGEDNPNLIDGNLGNKAFNTSISFTIYRASGFLFNAYTWATANDVPDRDPVRWILDASQDNTNWTVLDNKSTADQTITTSRNTYVQDFTF
jgi:hypothetical protein